MNSKATSTNATRVLCGIGVALRGPIASGDYEVGRTKINVSYPPAIDFGFPTPIELPKGLSTVFEVTWADKSGATVKNLPSQKAERHHPFYHTLKKNNELLLTYKLVRVGHADGKGIRTIGIGDTLFHINLINGQHTGDVSMGLKTYQGGYQGAYPHSRHPDDPSGTTEIAKPHIAADTYPIAKRYVRCFELLHHGFYAEALIVAFSILDELVQEMLHSLLVQKGTESRNERNDLVRGIKENRLRLYLGPMLKLLCGKSISKIWGEAETALGWLNKRRKEIAHQGYQADYSTAAKAIYACVKTLVVLDQHGLVESGFPVEIFRHAKKQQLGQRIILSGCQKERTQKAIPSINLEV